MPKRFDILKVRDKADSYYTRMDRIFDLPLRLIICGASQRTGKTTIILNLLLRNKYYRGKFQGEDIYIVSNNKMDNKLKVLSEELDVPEENTFQYDEELIDELYDVIEEAAVARVEAKKKPVPSLMIFDDCAYSSNLKNKTAGVVSRIAMNGRHINLSSIFTTQKYSLLSTGLRNNITGAILFGTSTKELELIEQDLNFLESKKQFMSMFRRVTKTKRSFLVVNFSNDDLEERYLDSNFEPVGAG